MFHARADASSQTPPGRVIHRCCMPASVPIPGAHGAIDDRPLHALLDERCAAMPDALAIRHLVDGETSEVLVTWSELSGRARRIAAWLMERRAAGKPVLLATAPGPEFIAGLFGCWHAGAIAVPAYPPRGGRHKRRMQAILTDSGAALAIGGEEMAHAQGVETLVSLDDSAPRHDGEAIDHPGPCLLQYTSGSTAAPKGVMIGHRNFRAHFASLECFDELRLKSALSWLPPYHDMGLVLKILYACEAGIPLTLFSPDHFIQRPARWLRAISRHRAELSGAPNFAFEACIRSIRDEELEGVDLSCWKAAPCGAERIRRETLDRFSDRFSRYGFRPEAFLPGYGLAETTLIVTACRPDREPRISHHPTAGTLVSCGAPLAGVSIRITDPQDEAPLPPGATGEIRVKAPVVSQGYWQRPDETRQAFGDDGELRTGDLGHIEDGELFVSGRIKDLIIIDGTNHSPDDIEGVAMAAAPEITAAAAFAAEADGRESATLAIEAAGLAESDRTMLCETVRTRVAEFLEIPLHRIVIVRSGLLPRTTSGKIRRGACGEALENGSLRILHDDRACRSQTTDGGDIVGRLLEMVTTITGRNDVRPDDDVIRIGMGSLDATRLAAMIRSRLGLEISVGAVFAAGSFAELAGSLASAHQADPGFPEIPQAGDRDSGILSHAQERMWFLHQFDPQSASYHVFGAMELRGDLSVSRLCEAFQEVVSKHGILLSRHVTEDGAPRVRIVEDVVPEVEILPANCGRDAEELLKRFARRPFRLDAEPPVRALLLDCGNQRHLFAVCAHHIAADGWSLRILANELAASYAGKPIPGERVSYQGFATAHRGWVDGGAVDGQIAYWKSRLAGHSGILQLPTDFPRPHHPSSDGGLVTRILPAELCNRIAAVAASRRTTPFAVHLAAFLLLLRQHGAGHDPVVAIPVANRNRAEAAGIVGTLVNTLPFRMTLDGGDTFAMLLDRVTQASFEMQENQDAPFEKIIEAVKPDRSTDHAPLAQVMFDHQEIPIAESWHGGLTCKPHMTHRGAAQFDLSLLLTVFNDHQQLAFEYRTDLFLAETIATMMERHLANLERLCNDPNVTASADPTHADKQRLAEISHGPERPEFLHRTTPELLARRAAMHPDRVAVRAGGSSLTYRNLADRSDLLASALHEAGIGPGDRVAVLLERDEDLPAGLLAVWKTGAAYVPLDRANPAERLRLILSDQAPLHVLVSPDLQDHLPSDIQPIVMDGTLLARAGKARLPEVPASGAAYVIYTSGSTGKPKGVVVRHDALANFLLSMAETPGFTEADRLLAVTTVSFDISALELFLPLVTGGSLEIVTTATARDGHLLIDALETSSATVMQATPATWRLLLDAGWKGSPHLKILCGGEALDLPLASRLAGMGCQLWNLYGPTETTVWSTVWRVPQNPDRIRIGTPIANTGVHVLSDEGVPLPPGVPGNLWISGSGLAQGYWNRPELTDSRFTPIPTASGETIRAYQTGDIARWHADGTLECLGRSDGQVKIRGFRVELGEIEEVLAGHPQVAQAKVALRGTSSATERLVAWIIAAPGGPAPDPSSLRDHLSERLPVYMLPADYGFVADFPLNANGKVDVSQLADPEATQRAEGPLTARERQIAALWCELLHRPTVHADDNWFHIGGHSLLALRLFARIHQETGRRIPLSAILDHATPRALAALIDQTAPEP